VQSILEAATQIFDKQGYDSTTTTHISERAGVSIGTLYQYFPDKESILFALAEQHLHEGESAIGQTMNQILDHQFSLKEGIELIVRNMFILHEPYLAFHQLLHEATPRGGARTQLYSQMERALLIKARPLALFETLAPPERDRHLLFVIRSIEALVHSFIAKPIPELEPDQVVRQISHLISAYCDGFWITTGHS
jgi:AcrR family transcriptional regulator